ncbi:MoxR family ATPase [Larkinella ripae]
MALVEKFTFDKQNELDAPRMAKNPSDYILDTALANAVRVAILLKQPLLLTGEPGTGKTRLAEKLAADLHAAFPEEYLERPLVFNTKTVSASTDLFYLYDALGHFHATHFDAAQSDGPNRKTAPVLSVPEKPSVPEVTKHIRLQALGQAIVLSSQEMLDKCPYLPVKDIDASKPRSSVVLIDEVDKAPRDFTNDLLNELDRFQFQVREDGNAEYKIGDRNVFVILTSNSENNLPDAFLRRCIFYHIKFPEKQELQKIVWNQIFNKFPDLTASDAKRQAVEQRIAEYITFFDDVKTSVSKKKPATAELISWIYFLRHAILNGQSLREVPEATRQASFSILAKHAEDLEIIRKMTP